MANQTTNPRIIQDRLAQVTSHLNGAGRPGLIEKHPDDIVVTTALRTAITKGGKGGFKDTAAADLLHGAFTGLLKRSGIDPSLVEDISVGSVLAPGGGATEVSRISMAFDSVGGLSFDKKGTVKPLLLQRDSPHFHLSLANAVL